MQLTLSQLDFSVSINSCHDEIMHKMQVLTNMEIQLLRKFQHQLSNSQMHYEMIHDVRVMIVNLEQVYKDVKEYFHQMGIQFVYDFFRKIQVLMVCGYNFLSQALLVNVDKIQDKKSKDSKGNYLECKVCKCTCPQNSKMKKREIKEVQHYDYKISMLQNQQQKLASQIQSIYQKMMMQKTMIQKTKPSLAIRQLQDMKQHIENVLQSTNSIFQETYMMKYVEFKNYLTQIKKPQDIVDYFISNMSFNMKEKFLKAMQKAIYKAQNMEERLERKDLKDGQAQTEKIKDPMNETINRDSTYRGFSSLKPQKNQSLLTKQRKYNQKMAAQVQFIRKQLNSLMQDNQKIRKQLQKKQEQRFIHQQNYQTLQQLYSKRNLQLQLIQNQNKWLQSQKQSQTKKLRLQIKELKKDQVEQWSQQCQTDIPPNCQSTATQTQLVFFQNQVDNEIINVLKKTNEKMVSSLNEKQRKIRQLKGVRDEVIRLKQTKIMCVGFLEDLRQVTTYKIAELNKEKQNSNKQKKIVRQPIIPLNENTSNQSIMITISKLTEEIKTLLLNSTNNSKKRIHDQRRSSSQRSSVRTPSKRNSSKFSQSSDIAKAREQFFRNSANRKNSDVDSRKGTELLRATDIKQSIYQKQYRQKSEKKSSRSLSSVSSKRSQSNSQKSRSQTKNKTLQNSFAQKLERSQYRRRSSIQSQRKQPKSNTVIQKQSTSHHHPHMKSHAVQTDLLKKSHHVQRPQHSNVLTPNNEEFIHFTEAEIQTDLTCQLLHKFEEDFQQLKQTSSKAQSSKNLQSYQSYSNRKHPYIRKPGARMTVNQMRLPQSDRNYLSVNHSMPMNESQISQRIQDQINSSEDQLSFANNSYMRSHILTQQPGNTPLMRQSNMTLESRLSTLINPNNRTSSNSGLIVFKKQNHDYKKRSSQMVFDELRMDKSMKDNKAMSNRNTSLNSYRNNDSILIQNDKKGWKQSIDKIQQENQLERQKQNLHRQKTQVPMKSIFIQKIMEQDENNSRALSNYQKLIEISRKTPVQRQRRFSPKSYQPVDHVFNRTVKQMLLNLQTKQSLVKKINELYEALQKQKQSKKLKRIIKGSYTPRNSDKKFTEKRKDSSQIFKLGNMLYQ